jgi:L,D-peptidoglycan transpeptidase YkuD (ErfK/YbiS/YcfS/YnhG family)
MRLVKPVVFVLCLVLGLAAPAAANRAGAPACRANVPARLTSTGPATQLITVVAPQRTSTRGTLRLWENVDGCWRPLAGPWSAWVGGRGVSANRREGDRTTPAGSFGIGRVMYGVSPNPGFRYRYRRIACGDWWVEDPRSPFYNQFRRLPCGARPLFRVTTGDMSKSPTAYRHLAVIRFNMDPVVPGRGSGIFLHASTGRPTLGCVSLPLAQLVRTLRWLRPASAPRIVIGTPADLRRL